LTATDDQRTRPVASCVVPAPDTPVAEMSTPTDVAIPLPRRGLLDRDWHKVLVVLLTLLASVAVLWVLWQVVSPILHTLVLFALAAVLAFALSGPVNMLTHRLRNRLLAIVAVYLVVGIVVVVGLTLIAGPFVRQATDLVAALPQYASDLQGPRSRSADHANTASRPKSTNSKRTQLPPSSRAEPGCSGTWWAPWPRSAE
jgi:AI-2E family transporter